MYKTIIPQHLQEELIQIGEDISRNIFRVGDIVISIVNYVEANGFDCTKRDIWRAVGSFIGKSASTVQGYEALASFYPQSVRSNYGELSSSHFKIAMKIDSTTEYDWQTVLEYAVDRVQYYGRPATVDELAKVFIYNLEPFEFDDDKPIEHIRQSPVDDFINHLSSLRRTAELLPVPEQTRAELLDALKKIEFVVNSLFVRV